MKIVWTVEVCGTQRDGRGVLDLEMQMGWAGQYTVVAGRVGQGKSTRPSGSCASTRRPSWSYDIPHHFSHLDAAGLMDQQHVVTNTVEEISSLVSL